ncbi:putative glucuronosyltransferase PGSIP8 [Sesbania bispinosa]|nr:putative glucuronosyltransferase PGSIP8 [Sesbania bispinosa]
MAWPKHRNNNADYSLMRRLVMVLLFGIWCVSNTPVVKANHKNAYATIMYVGTPRDYEFYVAIRVLFKSLASLNV